MKAIDIIHAERRALGAVIQAFRFVLDGIRAGTLQPDFALLDALIEYITEVPDKLQHDHVQGAHSTQALREALHQYQAAGTAGFSAFDALARTCIDATWKHIDTEEGELLPLARQRLAPQDWAGIDAAFEANKDPWSGATGEFRALFSRIVNRVPAPYGLGPA